MVDHIELNPGSGGDLLAADTANSKLYQQIKLAFGTTGFAKEANEGNPYPVAVSSNGQQNHLVAQFLDTTGDGTGTDNANGDYSATQGVFKIAPAAGVVYRISRLIISIEDTSGMTPAEYGNIGSALTNGIQIQCYNGTSAVCDFTNGNPITRNGDWAARCYDANLLTWGTSDEMLAVRWTFIKFGQYIRLDGDATEELRVLLDDDLTGLISHRFFANGYQENDPT